MNKEQAAARLKKVGVDVSKAFDGHEDEIDAIFAAFRLLSELAKKVAPKRHRGPKRKKVKRG